MQYTHETCFVQAETFLHVRFRGVVRKSGRILKPAAALGCDPQRRILHRKTYCTTRAATRHQDKDDLQRTQS